jgi:Arc/MetJ family transcription regulator
VHKTALRLDEESLAEGWAVLGTNSATETIHQALAEVVASQGRARLFQRLRTLDGLDLADEEVMRQAWR